MTSKTTKLQFDCSKCPGYCCSYPHIEIQKRDVQRLAKHFGLSYEEAERRFTRWAKDEDGEVRILRHQKDAIYGSICRFFDTEARRCTVYAARPGVCRQYPNGSKCGYYEFVRFERKHQDNPDFIPLT